MKTTTSEALFATAKNYFPGGVNSPVRAFKSVDGSPLFIKKGDGCRIWDEDDNEFVDFCCSWGPLILGHNHPAVYEKVVATMQNGTSFGAPTRLENELAELILSRNPFIEKLRFVSSGTEAVMSALRLARGYTGKDKVIKFEGCYHGHTDAMLVKAGSGLITFGASSSAGVPESFAQETIVLPLNDIEALKTCVATYKNEISCAIIEPIPANNGLLLQEKTFLLALREICTENGILLFFDEVISGFRVAFSGAAEHYGIKPDIVTYGKIIGGGLPVGAYGGRAEIMDVVSPVGPVYQAGTLSGNPVAMASGIATLTTLKQTNPYPRLESIAQTLVDGLSQLARDAGIPHTIPHVGSMFTLFFNPAEVTNLAVATQSDTKRFARYFHAMLERGIYLACSQYEANFISAMHTQEDIQRTLDAARQSFELISQS